MVVTAESQDNAVIGVGGKRNRSKEQENSSKSQPHMNFHG